MFHEFVDRLGPAPDPEAVLNLWAEDASWRHVHPEFQWETAAGGPLDTKATGPTEIARWWADWVEAWESYAYRVVEYRDLGEWVLTLVDVRAEGRGGIPVTMRTFEIRSIRDDKIAACRIFASEREALEAAGLRE
jgi:SnoaL-like protein